MPKDINKLVGTQAKAVPVKPKEIGIDTTQNLSNTILDAADVSKLDISALENFSTVAQTREEVYKLIDTMAQDDKISSILETYAEDTVEPNDSGKIVWVESNNEDCAKYISYLLEDLNVDKNMYGWAFKLCKYGDLYLRLYRESDYGTDLLFGQESKEKKSLNEDVNDKNTDDNTLKEDVNLKISRKDDHFVHYVEAISNPGEMFDLQKFGKTMGFIKAPVSIQQIYNSNSNIVNSYLNYKMNKRDVYVYDATEFVHACLEDNSSRTPEEVTIFIDDKKEGTEEVSSNYTVKRGQSLLANSFKIWRELTLLENSVLLNRITKSAIVRILSIDGGDMSKEQVQNFIARLKEKIEQKSAINVGNSFAEYTNPGPMENIIYVPTHGTQGTITSSEIGGNVDPKQLTDLDWFNNGLYGSFRIPKAYFGWTDDGAGFNGGTSLSILSARYGKLVKRIQNTLCQMITDIINIFLIDKGLDSYVNDFTIRMQSPITQEELDRRENMRNRIGVIGDLMNQLGNAIPNEVIKLKILKELLASSINSPEVVSLIQEQIDELENPETKTEEKEEQKENPLPKPISTSAPSESGIPELDIENNEESNETSLENEVIEPIEGEEGGEESYLPTPDELNLDMTNNGEF